MALAMVAATVWAGSLVAEGITTDIPLKLFWSKVEYLGVTTAVTFLLMFSLAFAGNRSLLRFPNVVLLWIAPAGILLVVWTNDLHGLMWPAAAMSPGTNVLIYGHGFIYYVALAYFTLVTFLAAAIVLETTARQERVYRLQAAVVAISYIPPWALGLIYTFQPSLVGHMDVTGLGFLLTCLLLSWSLTRHGTLDMTPIARDAVIAAMSDGVVVLDHRHRIVDVNPAARTALELVPTVSAGDNVWDVLSRHPQLVKFLQQTIEGQGEIPIERDGTRWLDVRVSLLADGLSGSERRLVVMRDITETVEMREELRALSLVDDLTGLNNRRGFLTLGRQELLLAARLGTSACVLVADLDGLKGINDRYGHHAGDRALKEVAAVLRGNCRESDLLGRLGGDEFALLAVGISEDKVASLVERVERAFRDLNTGSSRPFQVDASIGTSVFHPEAPAGLDDLLQDADRRMYQNKRCKGERPLSFVPPREA